MNTGKAIVSFAVLLPVCSSLTLAQIDSADTVLLTEWAHGRVPALSFPRELSQG